MPGGIPVGTLAIGRAGAVNAALLAAAILGAKHPQIREALRAYPRGADGGRARRPRSEEEQVKIGVLGGGQLGRMLALAGISPRPRVRLPRARQPRRCAGSASHVVAPPDDPRALDELASRVDVVTYEFENVPVAAARVAGGAGAGVSVRRWRSMCRRTGCIEKTLFTRARYPDGAVRGGRTRAPTWTGARSASGCRPC